MFDAILSVLYIVDHWGGFNLDDLLQALGAAAHVAQSAQAGGIGG